MAIESGVNVREATRSSVVAKRPCDCCVGQFWPKYNWQRIFFSAPILIGVSSTTVM